MKEIRPLLIANSICIAAMTSIIPVIGPIIRQLGLEEWHGGVIVTVAGLLWMFSARMWGRASDRLGRRHILLIGTSGYTLAYVGMAAFISYALTHSIVPWLALVILVLTRGLIGAFFAAIPTVTAAKIADITSPQQRGPAMSKLGAANAIGMVFGPTASGMVAAYGLEVPLLVAALLPFLAIALVMWGVKPDRSPEPKESPLIKLSDPRIRLPILAAFLCFNTIITAQMCVGFYALDKLHLTPADAAQIAGYAMGVVGITLIIVQSTAARLGHIRPHTWLLLGSVIAICGQVELVLFPSIIGLLLGYSLTAVGLGLGIPAFQALSANSVDSHEQGAAAGSLSAAQGLAAVVSPLISMGLYELSPWVPYVMGAILMGCLFLLSWVDMTRKPAQV